MEYRHKTPRDETLRNESRRTLLERGIGAIPDTYRKLERDEQPRALPEYDQQTAIRESLRTSQASILQADLVNC